MSMPDAAIAALLSDPLLPADFAALCDCGGRLAGTESEQAALTLLRRIGHEASGQPAQIVPAPYAGWRSKHAALHLIEPGRRSQLQCLALLRSASTPQGGIEAEVIPVGRGTPEEFAELGDRLHGRFALVRHEYMFAAGHIHRRKKYAAALAAGAAGFLIAGPLPAAPVAGSSGRGPEPGIPALGISPEAAARLAPPHGHARIHAELLTEEFPAQTETILFDTPGPNPPGSSSAPTSTATTPRKAPSTTHPASPSPSP